MFSVPPRFFVSSLPAGPVRVREDVDDDDDDEEEEGIQDPGGGGSSGGRGQRCRASNKGRPVPWVSLHLHQTFKGSKNDIMFLIFLLFFYFKTTVIFIIYKTADHIHAQSVYHLVYEIKRDVLKLLLLSGQQSESPELFCYPHERYIEWAN